MKKLSFDRLAETVKSSRKEKGLTQIELANLTGINRSMIGQLENRTFKPSIAQLEALAEALDFDITALFVDEAKSEPKNAPKKQYNIAVAGTGYVGLSIATLLSQHNHVTAVDIIPEKVELINQRKSPIQDEYIEKYLKKETGTVDYIHGDEEVERLCKNPENIGFLLPTPAKDELFKTVVLDGALPRKTFSMGHAQDKRFYLEGRKIR